MQRSLRGDPNQVPITLFVLRQHQQVVVIVALWIGPVVILLADVKLTAQNRLDAPLLRRLKEMHRAINIAVVGNRNRLLADVGNMVHQLFNIAGAIQKRIISMQVKVGEFSHDADFILVPARA